MGAFRSLLAVCACGAGCAEASDARDGPVDTDLLIDVSPSAQADPPTPICDLLPPTGPCALACDHDAFLDFVPPGTCAAFLCELTDGREIVVNACHPPA